MGEGPESRPPRALGPNHQLGARLGASVIAYHRVRVQPDRLSAGTPGLVSLCDLHAQRLPARLLPVSPLRLWRPLLLRRLYAARAAGDPAGGRPTVSAQPPGPAPPRRAPSALSRPSTESDASDFPAGRRVRHRAGAAPRRREGPGGGPRCRALSSRHPPSVRALRSPGPLRPAHHAGPRAAAADAAALSAAHDPAGAVRGDPPAVLHRALAHRHQI